MHSLIPVKLGLILPERLQFDNWIVKNVLIRKYYQSFKNNILLLAESLPESIHLFKC